MHTSELKGREDGLDRLNEDGIGGEGVGGEAGDDLSTAVDEELLEVPGELGSVVNGEPVASETIFEAGVSDACDGLGGGEGFVEGRLSGAGDDGLLEHGEGDLEGGVTELLNLLVGSWFLAGEVVGGEAEYVETAVAVGGVEPFQAFVLGGESAFGRGIDDEEDVALVGGECGGVTGDGFERDIEEGLHRKRVLERSAEFHRQGGRTECWVGGGGCLGGNRYSVGSQRGQDGGRSDGGKLRARFILRTAEI